MRKYSGFSLIELIAVLSIVAVLATLGVAGISYSQRASRDQERKLIGAQVQATLDSVLRVNGSYPATASVTFQANQISVSGKVVPLTGFKSYSATGTTATATRYVYTKSSSGYLLCVYLETGNPAKWGTSTANCP